MNSFAARSHPEYTLDTEHHAAPPETDADRALRLEWLREQVAGLAVKPDPLRADDCSCPRCGVLLDFTLGRNSGVWIVTHGQSRGCPDSGSLWRVTAASRIEAIALWRESEAME